MAHAFVGCDVVKEAVPALQKTGCCPTCHSNERAMIYVRPRKSDGNEDWELCIEGHVCCHVYHAAKALPRTWWEENSKRLGVYKSRDDGRGYVYDPEKKEAKRVSKVKPQKEDSDEGLKRGGINAFLGKR